MRSHANAQHYEPKLINPDGAASKDNGYMTVAEFNTTFGGLVQNYNNNKGNESRICEFLLSALNYSEPFFDAYLNQLFENDRPAFLEKLVSTPTIYFETYELTLKKIKHLFEAYHTIAINNPNLKKLEVLATDSFKQIDICSAHPPHYQALLEEMPVEGRLGTLKAKWNDHPSIDFNDSSKIIINLKKLIDISLTVLPNNNERIAWYQKFYYNDQLTLDSSSSLTQPYCGKFQIVTNPANQPATTNTCRNMAAHYRTIEWQLKPLKQQKDHDQLNQAVRQVLNECDALISLQQQRARSENPKPMLQQLLSSLSCVNALLDAKDVNELKDRLQALHQHIQTSAIGKSSRFKQLVGALLVLAGVVAIALTCVSFAPTAAAVAGIGLGTVGLFSLYSGRKTSMAKHLTGLESAVRSVTKSA